MLGVHNWDAIFLCYDVQDTLSMRSIVDWVGSPAVRAPGWLAG